MPKAVLPFSPRKCLWGPVTRARQARSMVLYACSFALAIGLVTVSSRPDVQALALGLIAPGGGFLLWAGPSNPMSNTAMGLAAFSLLLFLAALVLWFATGNVVLPVAVWLATALAAAASGVAGWGADSECPWQLAVQVVPLGAIATLGLACSARRYGRHRGFRRRARLNAYLAGTEARVIPESGPLASPSDELSQEDLQLMRLLLDRALQPVEDFNGFEWIDQFQTAAVRYQLNAASFALSVAQRVHLPAFQGYLHTAQRNLVEKQQLYRIWRYWRLENIWGNLRTGPDPIPRDNIMFTGFLAAQIAYAQSATGERTFDAADSLLFKHPSGERYAYSLPALIDVLLRGYREADYGLLACEPNWIYPLCNAISATAIRANDAAHGTHHWDTIEDSFRRSLETEFIAAGGRLIPCRSSYTGFAAFPIGGAVMQAFPCFFLNAVLPDIAERQWLVLQHDLVGRDWRRAFWPVDVGNYRFSRASSYAATAAAAVELGDSGLAKRLLQRLDEEYPLSASGNVANRRNASLWTHGIELVARCGRAGALRSLVTAPRPSPTRGPFIKHAKYPDILVAKAVSVRGSLFAVLYPDAQSGIKALTIGGLAPNRSYVAATGAGHRFKADGGGEARVELLLDGRTTLQVAPTD